MSKSPEEWNPVEFYEKCKAAVADDIEQLKGIEQKDFATIVLTVNAVAHQVVQEVEELAREYTAITNSQKKAAAVRVIVESVPAYDRFGISKGTIEAIAGIAVNAAVAIINEAQGHSWVKGALKFIGGIFKSIGSIFK